MVRLSEGIVVCQYCLRKIFNHREKQKEWCFSSTDPGTDPVVVTVLSP